MQQTRNTVRVVRGTGLAAIVVALLWTSVGLSSSTRARPQLKVLATRPLVVQGSHFRPRERVRVTAVTTARATRTVRATAAGTFKARFDSVSVGRCAGAAIRALGATGDRASSKVLQDQDCAPGLGP
jgi:hypothetical protein